MKHFFTCYLFPAALVLSIAGTGVNVYKNDPAVYTPTDCIGDVPTPSENNYFFRTSDAPVFPAMLNNLSNSGIPATASKAWNNPFHMLKLYFSLQTVRQLQVTKSVSILVYTRKEKDGYYIYALRKLLI